MVESESDPYSRVDYRRLIAWNARIAREAPLLRELLASSPDRSVLDLGCGTGEHAAFFAEEGARAVGVDASPAMLEKAAIHCESGARFFEGDLRDLRPALAGEPQFGMAICLGNVLPHLLEDQDLDRFVSGVASALLPGGVFLIQILNYAPILSGEKRHLPLNFRDGENGEMVFLRLVTAVGGGRVAFYPTTLEFTGDDDQPLRIASSRRVVLRGWSRADLSVLLARHGFSMVFRGSMTDPDASLSDAADLIVVARRS